MAVIAGARRWRGTRLPRCVGFYGGVSNLEVRRLEDLIDPVLADRPDAGGVRPRGFVAHRRELVSDCAVVCNGQRGLTGNSVPRRNEIDVVMLAVRCRSVGKGVEQLDCRLGL